MSLLINDYPKCYSCAEGAVVWLLPTSGEKRHQDSIGNSGCSQDHELVQVLKKMRFLLASWRSETTRGVLWPAWHKPASQPEQQLHLHHNWMLDTRFTRLQFSHYDQSSSFFYIHNPITSVLDLWSHRSVIITVSAVLHLDSVRVSPPLRRVLMASDTLCPHGGLLSGCPSLLLLGRRDRRKGTCAFS